MSKLHQVDIGAHSYGSCFSPIAFPPSVSIGRYVSIGPDVRVYNANHPMDRMSTHPYFYDPREGVVEVDLAERRLLRIEHDCWLGAGCIITPGCKRIGIGAIIGAGSVVTKDVDDFAIVAGVPAKTIKYRFPEELQKAILRTEWWERSIDDLKESASHLTEKMSHNIIDELTRSNANFHEKQEPERVRRMRGKP